MDWLSVVQVEKEDYGYGSFVESVDTVITGRKTDDKILSFSKEGEHAILDPLIIY